MDRDLLEELRGSPRRRLLVMTCSFLYLIVCCGLTSVIASLPLGERSEAISLKQSRLRRHVVPHNDRFFIQYNAVIPKTNLAVIPDLIRYPERPKLAPHVQITRVSPNQTCHSRIFKENIRYPF